MAYFWEGHVRSPWAPNYLKLRTHVLTPTESVRLEQVAVLWLVCLDEVQRQAKAPQPHTLHLELRTGHLVPGEFHIAIIYQILILNLLLE